MAKLSRTTGQPQETHAPEPGSQPHADIESIGFEEALVELEELIEKIESGEIGLEKCLEHYERGMKLIASCQSTLNQARKRIAEIKINPDGSLSTLPSQDQDDVLEGEPEA